MDPADDLGTLHHDSWPIELPLRARFVDQQAALAGAGCVEPGQVKATYGTGVFVLAHAATNGRSPAGGLLPTVAWRINGQVEWAIDGGVFTAGALLEWMSRDLGLAADPPALAAAAAEVDDGGGVRVLPALAGVGAPWWKSEARAVFAGMTVGHRPAHVARARALEGIAWRVAEVVRAVRETVPVELLRVDGGLTRDPTLLQLQADPPACRWSAAPWTRPSPAPRRWPPSAAGHLGLDARDRRADSDRRAHEPAARRAWRAARACRWREFVERGRCAL